MRAFIDGDFTGPFIFAAPAWDGEAAIAFALPPAGAIIDIGVTGYPDSTFSGTHSQTFDYHKKHF